MNDKVGYAVYDVVDWKTGNIWTTYGGVKQYISGNIYKNWLPIVFLVGAAYYYFKK